MAAYAYTITPDTPKIKKVLGAPGMGVFSGSIAVTNYNGTTPVAIAEIVSKFKGPFEVHLTPVTTTFTSSVPTWDSTNNTIRFTVISAGVFAQMADNTNAGTVEFIAIGPVN